MASELFLEGKILFHVGFVNSVNAFRVRLRGSNYNEVKTATFYGGNITDGSTNGVEMTSPLVFDCPSGAVVTYFEVEAQAVWSSESVETWRKIAEGDLTNPKTYIYQGKYYLNEIKLEVL